MINFYYQDTSFRLSNISKYKTWLKYIASNEKSRIKEISYIFGSDKFILEINREYLNHDYFTDVITFPYQEGQILSSDIFISIERIQDNCISFNTSFDEELMRVMAHGILHLVGFDDKNSALQRIMKLKEELYISKGMEMVIL